MGIKRMDDGCRDEKDGWGGGIWGAWREEKDERKGEMGGEGTVE